MPAYIVNVTVEDDQSNLDWDGPGTFYYRKDKTQALVLSEIDVPELAPAFSSAADIEALIDAGEFDLPSNAFDVLTSLVWAAEPPAPVEEEAV